MVAQRPKLTWDDYRSIPPDGKRYELIDGELHVKEGPALSGFGDVRHQRVAGRLFVRLDEVVRRRGLGEVFFGRSRSSSLTSTSSNRTCSSWLASKPDASPTRTSSVHRTS